MRAAYYERNGAARDVLRIGEIEISPPQPGEVQVRLHASGVNPSDVKSRAGLTRKIGFPRVIPHSEQASLMRSARAFHPLVSASESGSGTASGGVLSAPQPRRSRCRPNRP